MLSLISALFAKKIMPSGDEHDLGVLSTRIVTKAFRELIIDALQAPVDLSTFKYHATGTGTGEALETDTTLQAEIAPRTLGSQEEKEGEPWTYQSIATVSYVGEHSITEHGILSDTIFGTLLDRSVFEAIEVADGDQVEFTYLFQVAECAVIETLGIPEEIPEDLCSFSSILIFVETLEHYLKTISPSVFVQGIQDTLKDHSITERQFHDLDTKIHGIEDYDVARRNLDIMKDRYRK